MKKGSDALPKLPTKKQIRDFLEASTTIIKSSVKIADLTIPYIEKMPTYELAMDEAADFAIVYLDGVLQATQNILKHIESRSESIKTISDGFKDFEKKFAIAHPFKAVQIKGNIEIIKQQMNKIKNITKS